MKIFANVMLFLFAFAATSCLSQGEGQYIPGVAGPHLNIQDGKVLLSIELENVDIIGGATFPIKKMKKSNVTIAPAMRSDGTMGGTLVRVALDPRDVESDNFRVVPHETLPDGRPFPFLVEGTLPALAINVPKAKDATFYVSKKVFGIFLPIKLPEDFTISVHYKLVVNKKDYGIVSLIHPDEHGEGAGVLALLTMEKVQSDPGLKRLLKISKKNKSRIY